MVGSGGASPAYAQKIRDLVGEILPRQPASFYAGLRAGRQKSQGQGKAPDPAPAPAQAADPGLAAASLPLAEVPPAGFEKLPPAGPGPVFLVGCGPGKRAHLTLEALRLLPTLEVALVDALAGPEIVDLLSPACQKIDVGKRKGRHTMPQEAINALLLAYARRGFRVGRLKGGDPLAFGRLQEEVAFLQAHGIEAQVLCGVGSFQAGAAAAGIFPTVRGASQGFAVVSAHLREALFNDSWLDLLRAGRFTVAVLMAHSFAGKIVEAARAKGIGLDMPCAFVSQIDREGGQAVFGRLGELEAMARRCAPPAVLFIGPAGALPAAVPCTEGLALP
jgi:uroporphyrin-III C-methyltransferase/precorrin-2 dehydrogenase/sirohydrochlorin ferrochelatase